MMSADRYKVYFSGFPKDTCHWSDVYNLFSRVVQIKSLWISFRKGYGYITLYSESSVQFIFQQDIQLNINGCSIKLEEFMQNNQDDETQKQNLRILQEPENLSRNEKNVKVSVNKLTYQHYKNCRSQFWKDVPHEKAMMVMKKTKKKRLKTIRNLNVQIQTCKNLAVAKKKMKRKRKRKVKVAKMYQGVGGLHGDYSLIHSRIKEDIECSSIPRKSCVINPEQCYRTGTHDPMENTPETGTHDPEENTTETGTHNPMENTPEACCSFNINISESCSPSDVNNAQSCHPGDVNNPQSCHPGDVNNPQSCHPDVYIPLYIKIDEKIYLKNFPHIDDIFDFVYKVKGIPPKFQLLIYQGKVLKGNWYKGIMEPYTTVEVIVKGKGGMMEATGGSYPHVITNESTEEDIRWWLEHVVKISDEVLSQFPAINHLDGGTLLAYKKNFLELKQDIEVPIGIARKILLSLDHDFLKKWEASEMYSWSFQEFIKFIKESIGDNEECVLVEASIRENFIDALSFYSYGDSQALKKDLDIRNVSGVIYKRLIAKRNSMLEKSESHTKPITHADKDPEQTDSKLLEKEEKGLTIHHKFLNDGLGLKKAENVKEFTSCKLFIIYSSWTKANDLERLFLFFVLCSEDDFTNKQSKTFLWNQIRKNVKLWLNALHKTERYKFTIVEHTEDTVIYKCNELSFSKSNIKTSFFMDKDIKKILQHTCHFLFISSKLLGSKSSFYQCLLSEQQKKKCSYDFSLDEGTEYWFFNPDDFADGFQKRMLRDFHLEYIQGSRGNTQSTNSSVSNETAYPKPEMAGSKIQNPRPFREEATHIVYHENSIFSIPESDGTLSDRCFEFKYFTSSLKSDNNFTKFVRETLRFGCGVLNARKNGTICFGVGDNVQHEDGEKFKHGQIIGFPITEENRDCKTNYTDALRQGISKCFNRESCNAALQCIKNPVFVTVLTEDKQMSKFVMEVDICSLSNFCQNLPFRVNLNKYGKLSKKYENDHLLFLRQGSTTKKLSGDEELMFLKIDFEQIIKSHKDEEQANLINKKAFRETSAFYKLQELFCRRSLDKFDVHMWPIFVLTKPSGNQKIESFFRNLSFLKKIKSIVAVFDFDEKSDEDGISFHIRNKDETELHDESIFKEYSGKFDTLKSHLRIPQEDKTIWIFSNGRSGILEPKPHLKQAEWRLKYKSGISDAISFFNQPNVIPKERAMFIFLLFTNELEGVIDTFIDVISRFSLEQVIVLAEKKIVYDTFKTLVRSAVEIDVDLFDKRGVFDVSWEQISTSLKSFLGEEDIGNCMLATSNGILMPTDERFLESLNDLTVLSATQCENKDFGPDKNKKSQEEEFKFYKGNRVSWWNFYFETHVLKRHNFDRLKDKVQKVLQSEIQDQRVVVTVPLLHEPGAGGSTLANHILWEFRKNYKCCIIRKITERTHIQLRHLWEFKEQNPYKANPLLILVDELTDTEYLYEDLVSKIHTEFRKPPCPSKPFCCIILCDTEEQLKEIPKAMTEILSECLYQRLTDDERGWLEIKYKELEKTGKKSGISGFKLEYLLSFMILRSGFNEEYVKKTIKSLLLKIQKFPNEFNLLKYASLISCYVSSKHNGPKVHIPIDCCDELMGARLRKYKYGWYQELSLTVEILLIVEEKNHKNGSQIRMAHPVLAKEVLNQIRRLANATIGDITNEFLESSLLKSNTHGRHFLEKITREMLIKRKKLEDRDELTDFSPLIQDILNEDGQNKAIELLIKGLRIFNSDHFIAQTIARLYAQNKEFDQAEKWARDAVKLALPSGKSYCIHTLGSVLKKKFVAKTTKLGTVEPSNAKTYLELAIEALDNFLKAQGLTESRVLFVFYDTINIINTITNFLTKNIQVPPDFDWKKYLSDPDYIPHELNDWRDLHEHLKNLQKHGLEAFDTLEGYRCFYTVFNSHSNEEASEQTRSVPRTYRILQSQYPQMFSTFSDFFGESELIEPSFSTVDSKNQWLRKKVLHMKGNSFMNIFQIFYDIKKLNKTDALDKMKQIHGHLSRITKRDSRDLCNLVCVNFALALLGEKRESDETIFNYCKLVIRNKTYGVPLAHFFMMILLWPTSEMIQPFDDELFQSSLKFLHENNWQKYKEKLLRGSYSSFRDDEYTICQVTPQFFLTKEKGFKSVCSGTEILFREQQDSGFNNTLWENEFVKQKLKKLEGQVQFTEGYNKSYILVENKNSNKPIEIRKLRTGRRNILSEERVTFYLGFSMAGPVAFNIKRVHHENYADDDMSGSYYNPEGNFRALDEVKHYSKKSLKELQQLIKKISYIKEKMRKSLSQKDQLLLQGEGYIRAAIDIKEGKDTMD